MVLSASTLSGLRSSQGGNAPGVPGGGAWISLYVPHFMEPLSHEPSNLGVQVGEPGAAGAPVRLLEHEQTQDGARCTCTPPSVLKPWCVAITQ